MTRRVRSSNNGHTERNLAVSSARLSMLSQHNNHQHRMLPLFIYAALQAAMRMLAKTDMPIKQIAYALGYHHTSSFVRAFELHAGVSPGDYRKYEIREQSTAVAANKTAQNAGTSG